jgi:hypothetical protein
VKFVVISTLSGNIQDSSWARASGRGPKIREPSVLLRLDPYQEYDHVKIEGSHLSRITRQIPRHHSPFINKLRGNQAIAWIYVYDQSPDGKEKIEKSSWEGIDWSPSFR